LENDPAYLEPKKLEEMNKYTDISLYELFFQARDSNKDYQTLEKNFNWTFYYTIYEETISY
jgi:hypothetical protein